MFSGIGGFELGIKKARGITEWECIGFSEIDKYAIQIYERHFNHKNYGNARDINPKELPDFDMLCGGFPCQSFSIAGKRKGFQDTRGTLFHEICRIVAVKKPRLLFLENVKGLLSADDGRCFATILSSLDELGYSCEWQVLNSKNFGVPQNRERVFIIGHLRGEGFRQVLPIGEDGKSFDKSKQELPGKISAEETANCLTNRYHKMATTDNYIQYARKDKGQYKRVYETEGISPTLAGASKLSGDCTPKVRIYDDENKRWLKDDICGTIQGHSQSRSGFKVMPVLTPDREEKKQNGRRFKEDDEDMFTLTGQDVHGVMLRDGRDNRSCLRGGRTTEVGFEGQSIRRLTPTECERLQGFPDGWTEGISDTQRYKCLGNAVTVNVIEEVIKEIQEITGGLKKNNIPSQNNTQATSNEVVA
jgi:DNA (cytosine-5)-methyltransferase 1|tara:strand:+ start:102 stop:1355 length:1254 start_codon:yes stop_codon:yes gene_type:complete